MGEARNRGTKEERVTQAKKRKEQRHREWKEKQKEIERNMTPEEKKERHKTRMFLASMQSMIAKGELPSPTKLKKF